MAHLKTLQDLLNLEVKLLYSAEKLVLAGLPRLIERARNRFLVAALEMHLAETRQQRERLKQVGELLSINPNSETNPAMKGIIDEGEENLQLNHSPEVMDAAIIASAQKMEHYEISGYGTASCLAEELGHTEVAELLRVNLEEEQKADSLLNTIAETCLLPNAERNFLKVR